MNTVDILILSGSPGSGKSTLTEAISEKLRENGTKHAVIDFDALARVSPTDIASSNALNWKNLAAIWPNYVALGNIKVIIPKVIDTASDLEALKRAAPAKSITICELIAPLNVLKERVTKREPNEYWQKRLQNLVESYERGSNDRKVCDFTISTHNKSMDEAAEEILERVGWGL
jgi:adenylylsulfate kinase-like enzyme